MSLQKHIDLYLVDRSLQAKFNALLEALGYDEWDNELMSRDEEGMIVRPYNWGDCESDLAELVDGYEVGCPCPVCEPNFEHRPSGFKLWWYKHPLRAADSTQLLTAEMIDAWTDEATARRELARRTV